MCGTYVKEFGGTELRCKSKTFRKLGHLHTKQNKCSHFTEKIELIEERRSVSLLKSFFLLVLVVSMMYTFDDLSDSTFVSVTVKTFRFAGSLSTQYIDRLKIRRNGIPTRPIRSVFRLCIWNRCRYVYIIDMCVCVFVWYYYIGRLSFERKFFNNYSTAHHCGNARDRSTQQSLAEPMVLNAHLPTYNMCHREPLEFKLIKFTPQWRNVPRGIL